MSKQIPIKVGKDICEKYGYDQVVIYARSVDSDEPMESLTTYGVTKEHCLVVSLISEKLQKK